MNQSKWSVLAIGLASLWGSAQAAQIESPFLSHKVDLEPLSAILAAKPEELPALVNQLGAKIYLPPATERSGARTTPFLKGVPRLGAEQYERFKLNELFGGTVGGVFISSQDPCCDLQENFIVIAEDALPLTLVHESMHYLFHSQRTAAELEIQKRAEAEIERDRRALKFRFDKVFRDLSLLSNRLWRRDLMNSVADYNQSLRNILSVSLSEEVLIERSLQALVKPGSPLHDSTRLDAGEAYAKSTLDFIRVLIADTDFITQWLKGEFKVLEGEMELAEKYGFEKKFAEYERDILDLAEKYHRLTDYQFAP